MARKPHANAVLLNLPMEQQAALCEMLLGGISYRAAVVAMQDEWKVKTNTDAVFNFYHDICMPELQRRRAVAVSTADSIVDDAKETPGQWDEAALEKLGQYALELMITPGVDPKAVKATFTMLFKKDEAKRAQEKAQMDRDKLELERERLELEKRKVALQEQKAAAADAAKEELAKLRDPSAGLNDAERKAIIDKVDEILGLKS